MSLDYSTYLSSSSTTARAIALDPSGDAFLTGQTTASTFPTTAGAFQATRNAAT